MVLDSSLRGASATPRPQSYPKQVTGFLLSRQVEGCSPLTVQTYSERLASFFKFQDDISIEGIDSGDVLRFLGYLQKRGHKPQYIHAHFRVMRTFFNWCIAEQFIDRSPMRNIKPPKLPKEGRPFLYEVHRDKLLRRCPPTMFTGARNGAIVWFFWSTGARRHEIANLQLADLEWQRDRIRVMGKGARERYVPFSKEAKRAVWRYLSYRDDEYPCLWITEERLPMGQGGMIMVMRRLFDGAGLRGEVVDLHHVFRRSWAMRNLRAGRSLRDLMAVGGWESEQMLMRYVRAMESEDALAAKWV